MRLGRRAGAALALTAVAVAGCENGVEPDRLDQDAFREQATAICAEYDTRIAEIPTPESLPQLAESAERIAALIAEGTEKLWNLVPPESDEDDFVAWLDLNDAAALNARRLASAAGADERDRVVVLAERARKNEAEADALARKLELPECLVAEPAGASGP